MTKNSTTKSGAVGQLLKRAIANPLMVVGYILVSSWLVLVTPRDMAYGLAAQGAFLLFVGSVLIIYLSPIANWLRGVLAFTVLLVFVPLIGTFNQYYIEVITQVCIYAALALGLNIVVGFAGLLDLGYVAFYLVGAYTWAFFGSPQGQKVIPVEILKLPLDPWWFFPFLFVAIFLAAMTGIMLGLPVLRVRGDYLAVVTLGFGELIRVVTNNLDKPINITNGPQGITPIERPPLFFLPWINGLGAAFKSIGLDGIGSWMANATPAQLYPIYFYLLVLAVIGIVIFVSRRLVNSRMGRAWEAVREDEEAAQAMGIAIVPTKLTAFATGAAFAGVMGMLFASKQVFINPESFTFLESIGVLAMVIIGGMGSIPGVVLGATALTVLNLQILPNLSLALNSIRQANFIIPIINYNLANLPTQLEPAKYQRLVFGIVLIVMMIVRPEGLLPAQRRRIEIHAAEEQTKETE